jgi:hypothetical protein
MVDGDLVVVSVRYRASSTTITVGTTGGQTWTQVGAQYNTTNIRAAIFWCRYNGTWSANPSFTVTSGTNNMDAQMLVFRPTAATYTWSMEAFPTPATYGTPTTPFTVTITGRDTTAASTVTIGAWHSIDDNSWGSLSGSGWSKTSLGAQYRNNSTNDNSSTFAYNIRTTAGTVANASQNQSALGGDAGSTALVTFAETLVAVTLGGQSSTTAAGSLGISQAFTGIAGVESVSAVGDLAAIVPGGGTNATATPSGAVATAAIGVLALLLSQVAEPVGVGAGTAVGALSLNIVAVVGGVSSAPAVGNLVGLGGSAGVVAIGGVNATPQVGTLGVSHPIVGIEGALSTASVGTLQGFGAGILHGAGQPSSVFATPQAGSIAVAITQSHVGVSAQAVIEPLLAASLMAEVDGNSGSTAAGDLTLKIGTTIQSVSAATAAGGVVPIAASVVPVAGVQALATTGNLVGITSGAAFGAPAGVESAAAAGAIAPAWTFVVDLTGVESVAQAGDAAIEGGDSTSEEVFPSGVEAVAQVGAVSTGEAFVAIQSVQTVAIGGQIGVVGHSPGSPSSRHHVRPNHPQRRTVQAGRRRRIVKP